MRGDRTLFSRRRIPAETAVVNSVSFAVRHHLALRENKATVVEIMSPKKATAEMAAAMDSIVSMNRINYAPSPQSLTDPPHIQLYSGASFYPDLKEHRT